MWKIIVLMWLMLHDTHEVALVSCFVCHQDRTKDHTNCLFQIFTRASQSIPKIGAPVVSISLAFYATSISDACLNVLSSWMVKAMRVLWHFAPLFQCRARLCLATMTNNSAIHTEEKSRERAAYLLFRSISIFASRPRYSWKEGWREKTRLSWAQSWKKYEET